MCLLVSCSVEAVIDKSTWFGALLSLQSAFFLFSYCMNIPQMRYICLGNSLESPYVLCFQGLMFLVYPLLGHLADVYLTRYRTLKCGIIAIVVSLLLLFALTLTHSLVTNVFNTQFPKSNWLRAVIIAPGVIITIIGLGLFEANAIQFGLDQLLEAPTPKLITFIHWYYWSQNWLCSTFITLVTLLFLKRA